MAELQMAAIDQELPGVSLASQVFTVKHGDLLKFRVNAVDIDTAVNARALVCQIEFFDSTDRRLELPIDGASVSNMYGSYVYIESLEAEKNAQWTKEVVVVPDGACSMRLTLHPWKSSPQIKVLRDIECQDVRRIATHEVTYNIAPGSEFCEKYEILPFWRILYSFEILRKTKIDQPESLVHVSFLDGDGNVLDSKTATCKPVIGGIRVVDNLSLPIVPTAFACDYAGYEKLGACIQLIAPPSASFMRIEVTNSMSSGLSALLAQQICVFESIIVSRLAADSGPRIAKCERLSLELARLSFAKLQEKYPEDSGVYLSALRYYLKAGRISELTIVANHILNRFQGGEALSEARYALSIVKELDQNWLPSVGAVEPGRILTRTTEGVSKVAHLVEPDVPLGSEYGAIRALEVVAFQNTAFNSGSFFITPLGYPSKGETGSVWEVVEIEAVRHYYLNCISHDQLQVLPLTTQMNFAALLIKQILVAESAGVIHAHDGVRGYDLALLGLALSKALRLPLVYERRLSAGTGLDRSKELDTPFRVAKQKQDYRCLKEAHAIIVPVGALQEDLQEYGIDSDKIFLLPALSSENIANNVEMDKHKNDVSEMYCRAYRYAQRALSA